MRCDSGYVQLQGGVLKGMVRGGRSFLPLPPSYWWRCGRDGWPQAANLDHEVEAHAEAGTEAGQKEPVSLATLASISSLLLCGRKLGYLV